MKKYEKEVQQAFLDNEEAVLKQLKTVYDDSLDSINRKVAKLDMSISQLQKALADVGEDEIGELAAAFLKRRGNITPAEARETLRSMIQSKVYQKNYQTALKKQVGDILDKMHDAEFKTISDYLIECYDNGFIGAMYSIQQQGIPLCMPIDQTAVVRAVQLDSKISKGLYSRLGEDVTLLKKKIAAQVSRGISTGMSYQQVAQQLAANTSIGYNNAVRIARTEGHRVQTQSAMNASYSAKEKGADVLKQWDAALDARTRDSHAKVDGEIRELDKPFSNGLMFPGDPSGRAAEVINCRCALLQRARWALDDAELETLRDRAAYFGLDKAENFEEYKKTYLKAAKEQAKATTKAPYSFTPAKTVKEAEEFAKRFNVSADYSKYNIDVANAINETLLQIEDTFGARALDRIHHVSTFPKGYSTKWKGVYVANEDALWLRNVSRKDAMEKLRSVAQEAYRDGHWSTPEAQHTIRHELGHALHYALGNDKINGQLNALRQSIIDERLKRHRSGDHNHKYSDWLSEYGFTNTKEFVAESIAEYLAGNPRETAVKVVEIFIKGG